MIEKGYTAMHSKPPDAVALIEMLRGRWRSQIIHAAVDLGVFEQFPDDVPTNVDFIANAIRADAASLYRLLRALGALGLLKESRRRQFSITSTGKLLRADHPQSLRATALLEEGPVHYAIWRHLPAIIRHGGPDGFAREFGMTLFDYMRKDQAYAQVFQQAMTSYTAVEADAICASFQDIGLNDAGTFCDIGGGYGYLLGKILDQYPDASGVVFDLPEVSADTDRRETSRASLKGRCRHQGGDMFKSLPSADVYLLKHIIHDWNSNECLRILAVARRAARTSSRLFIYESMVPGEDEAEDEPCAAMFTDIHMMCITPGRQRSIAEQEQLLTSSGWKPCGVHHLQGIQLVMLEARPLS